MFQYKLRPYGERTLVGTVRVLLLSSNVQATTNEPCYGRCGSGGGGRVEVSSAIDSATSRVSTGALIQSLIDHDSPMRAPPSVERQLPVQDNGHRRQRPIRCISSICMLNTVGGRAAYVGVRRSGCGCMAWRPGRFLGVHTRR